jgi:hypothetical protein
VNPHNWWVIASVVTLATVAIGCVTPLRYDIELPASKSSEVRDRLVTCAFIISLAWSPYWGPHALQFVTWACK